MNEAAKKKFFTRRKTVGSVSAARYGATTIHTACRALKTSTTRDGQRRLERRELHGRDLHQDSGTGGRR